MKPEICHELEAADVPLSKTPSGHTVSSASCVTTVSLWADEWLLHYQMAGICIGTTTPAFGTYVLMCQNGRS